MDFRGGPCTVTSVWQDAATRSLQIEEPSSCSGSTGSSHFPRLIMSPMERGRILNTSVLVLNRHYLAVRVVTARRAFILLFREVAEVIDIDEGQFSNYDFESWCALSQMRTEQRQYHEDWVRSVNLEVQVPRIIRLVRFDRQHVSTMRLNRRNLLARDEHRCQYCGQSLPASQLSLDHVLPRSRGGQTTWENVVASCVKCNTKKGSRTPQEARMQLITKPSRPSQNPVLAMKLGNPKYESWKSFLPRGSWMIDLNH
jgi:5-methylcytosine-specific restriction endonuclease McrA